MGLNNPIKKEFRKGTDLEDSCNVDIKRACGQVNRSEAMFT